MRFDAAIDVAAPPDEVFDTWVDVGRWPAWAGVTRAERLDPGPLRVGSRAWLRQPGLPVAVWQVTDLVPGESFTWTGRRPGVRVTATHRVAPLPGGRTRVTATLVEDGFLGGIVCRVTRSLTEGYLTAEVRGLKAHCDR